MSDVLLALGILVVLATASSVVLTLILPRAPRRSGRFTRVVVRSVQVVFILISRLGKSYETKDAILAPTAPVALVAQLLYWAGGFILGYALMLLPFVHNVGDALSQAATSLFTLGAIPVGGSADQPVDIAAGATWAVIVALQIAYLPALYSAFNKREGLVTMLESRAGLPSWGQSCWPATSWWASPTPWPSSTTTGRSGGPTSPRATPPTQSCCCSARPNRGPPG